jgi:alpha-glucuronidase
MNYSELWLDHASAKTDADFCGTVAWNNDCARVKNAVGELKTALTAMTGRVPELIRSANYEGRGIFLCAEGEGEAFEIFRRGETLVIKGGSAGVLYGAFALIRGLVCGDKELCTKQSPSKPLRMLDHWDNADGSVERGYSGNSFFFRDGELLVNERTVTYARLLASVGINAAAINNVNVKGPATRLITEEYYGRLRELSEIFDGYGIKLFLSLNYAAPMELGGLDSADPLDERVAAWWNARMKETFEALPKLGGFVVKADSEGRPGPFTYGRTHADGANMLARAVRPYGGKIIWRCFVYNCQQDWRDLKTDRARACCDNFEPLDGMFDDNVILQIKNGPVDFQVREPVSPLFGRLKRTNCMAEFQIAQEYTGQQRHVCYLIDWFRQVLDTRMYTGAEKDTVGDIVCGVTAVSNTGDDFNWTGHDLAGANLYGFGRLAWDTSLSAERIAREWICMYYGRDEELSDTVCDILMRSWPVYEKYNAPLGIGWMCTPGYHYGPDPDGYEYSRWGTYHKATHETIGLDRTPSGTGMTEQYNEPLRSVYADRDKCPDELKLFFHKLPYTFRLKSGKTVIQHIYDTHFEGAEEAAEFVELWKKLKDRMDAGRYERVLARLVEQSLSAAEWRDVINSYFWRKTMIPDEKGRELY